MNQSAIDFDFACQLLGDELISREDFACRTLAALGLERGRMMLERIMRAATA